MAACIAQIAQSQSVISMIDCGILNQGGDCDKFQLRARHHRLMEKAQSSLTEWLQQPLQEL